MPKRNVPFYWASLSGAGRHYGYCGLECSLNRTDFVAEVVRGFEREIVGAYTSDGGSVEQELTTELIHAWADVQTQGTSCAIRVSIEAELVELVVIGLTREEYIRQKKDYDPERLLAMWCQVVTGAA